MEANHAFPGSNPPPRPELEYDPTIAPLPPKAEAVLEMIFAGYQRAVIVYELKGGLTESQVFVVRPYRLDGTADLPLVVKIGPAWLIAREQAAYQRYIRDTLSGRIGLVKEAISGSWGALGYRLAGDGQFKHESLSQFCARRETEAIREVLTGRLFKRLETLWRNVHSSSQPYRAAKYDLLLPVHLLIEPQALPPGASPFRLTPEWTEDHNLVQGDWVRLEGFVITEVDSRARTVTVDLPPGNGGAGRSHRLRLQPVEGLESYQVGQPLSVAEGVVSQTRRERLQAEVEKIVGPFWPLELTDERLRGPDGRSLPNPLAYVPALLADWPTVKLAYLHGDLNLENVLVDPQTGDVTLIDFTYAGQEHVLHDLLHLETSVVTELLPAALVEVGAGPDLICTLFYERLQRAASSEPALFAPPPLLQPALKKVYVILATIRQTAQAYLSQPDDWTEYYQGLALYLIGALKFKNLDQLPEAPYPKQIALLGAATAIELWQEPPERQVPAWSAGSLAAFRAEVQAGLAGRVQVGLEADTFKLPGRSHRAIGQRQIVAGLCRAGAPFARRGGMAGCQLPAWPAPVGGSLSNSSPATSAVGCQTMAWAARMWPGAMRGKSK